MCYNLSVVRTNHIRKSDKKQTFFVTKADKVVSASDNLVTHELANMRLTEETLLTLLFIAIDRSENRASGASLAHPCARPTYCAAPALHSPSAQ